MGSPIDIRIIPSCSGRSPFLSQTNSLAERPPGAKVIKRVSALGERRRTSARQGAKSLEPGILHEFFQSPSIAGEPRFKKQKTKGDSPRIPHRRHHRLSFVAVSPAEPTSSPVVPVVVSGSARVMAVTPIVRRRPVYRPYVSIPRVSLQTAMRASTCRTAMSPQAVPQS
jgi:hypothetical protein